MSKKNKIIIVCLAVLIVVVLAITIPLVLIKFNGNTKLATPKVKVIESENLIVFEADKVEGAKGYEFLITFPNKITSERFPTESNILIFDFINGFAGFKEMFAVAGIYSVQCYVTAEDAKNNSYKSSPIMFTRTLQLNSTRVDKKGKDIIWDKVEYADTYELTISSNYGTHIKKVDGSQSISISELTTEFELQNDVLYYVSVRAFSDSEYYSESLYSNQKEFYINQ